MIVVCCVNAANCILIALAVRWLWIYHLFSELNHISCALNGKGCSCVIIHDIWLFYTWRIHFALTNDAVYPFRSNDLQHNTHRKKPYDSLIILPFFKKTDRLIADIVECYWLLTEMNTDSFPVVYSLTFGAWRPLFLYFCFSTFSFCASFGMNTFEIPREINYTIVYILRTLMHTISMQSFNSIFVFKVFFLLFNMWNFVGFAEIHSWIAIHEQITELNL